MVAGGKQRRAARCLDCEREEKRVAERRRWEAEFKDSPERLADAMAYLASGDRSQSEK
jgi:hypothetical protein